MATAASATASTASEAMAPTSALQCAKQPKLEGYKMSRGVTNPKPSTVARHRKTGGFAVKQEATAAVVKKEATGAVVKKEAAAVRQGTTRAVVKQEAKAAQVDGPVCSRGSQDNASKGNVVKRERRRVGDARVQGPSSPKTIKREKAVVKKGPRKADSKVKVKAEQKGRGGENAGRKKISPRLAEKAALIISVMDALYPDPPIPINHVVRVSRGERHDQRERGSSNCPAKRNTRTGFIFVCAHIICVAVVFLFQKLVLSSICS